MKIEKFITKEGFLYFYRNDTTNKERLHGLINNHKNYINYYYHGQIKGFCLKKSYYI